MSEFHVDRGDWAKLDIYEQMGNIGSEVGRAIKAKQTGNSARFEGALNRALDLFEATVDVLASAKSARLREVLIAKEQFLNLFFSEVPKNEPAKIEKYFM